MSTFIAFEVSYGSTKRGIGNVTANTGLVEMAMAYSRSRVICAAVRLGVADALEDEVCSVGFMAEECQADANALYRLLRALASIGVTEETTPEHFRLTPKERSEREWRTLLEAAGFVLTMVYPVGGDNLMVRNVGILEAKPA